MYSRYTILNASIKLHTHLLLSLTMLFVLQTKYGGEPKNILVWFVYKSVEDKKSYEFIKYLALCCRGMLVVFGKIKA